MEPSKESLYRFWPIRQFYVVGKEKTYESGSVEESLKIISAKFISCEEGRVGFKSPTFFILETDARNFNSDALTSHRLRA